MASESVGQRQAAPSSGLLEVLGLVVVGFMAGYFVVAWAVFRRPILIPPGRRVHLAVGVAGAP